MQARVPVAGRANLLRAQHTLLVYVSLYNARCLRSSKKAHPSDFGLPLSQLIRQIL